MQSQIYPIKVLHLRASPFLGSPERLLIGRLKILSYEICQYGFGIFNEQDDVSNDFFKAVKKKSDSSFLLKSSMIYFFLNLAKILEQIKYNNYKLICAHDYKSGFYGFFLHIFFKIPVIYIFHGETSTSYRMKIYNYINRFLLRFHNAIVFVSNNTNHRFKKNFVKVKKYIIQNAVDIEEIKNRALEDDNIELFDKLKQSKIVAYVGRLSHEKGLTYLLKAAAEVQNKGLNFKLLIIGEGPEKNILKKMVLDLQINKSVYFLGFKKNIYPYLNKINFLVLPSLSEGMPVVILEAFALEKAVLASEVGGIPEVVKNEINGQLVKSKSVDDLVKSISFLLINTRQAIKMGRKGFELVKQDFNFELQVKKYIDVYRNTLLNCKF